MLALAAGILAILGLASPAAAIPPGGAGADTPGTSAGVATSTLRAGEVIRFTVSGFPTGEVVYVKIDDGKFCAKAGVHGACVVHQQRIPGSGRVSGSFVLPGDLKPGKHWLRFLASKEMTDAAGNYLGVKGYTCRGNADFTIVSSAGTSGGASSAAGGSGSTGSEQTGSTSAGPGVVEADGVRVVKAGGTLRVPAPAPASSAPSPDPSPVGQAPVAAAPVSQAVPVGESRGFPFVGTIGLVLFVATSAVVLLRPGRRMRRPGA